VDGNDLPPFVVNKRRFELFFKRLAPAGLFTVYLFSSVPLSIAVKKFKIFVETRSDRAVYSCFLINHQVPHRWRSLVSDLAVWTQAEFPALPALVELAMMRP